MNQKINKNEIIDRISKKLSDERIVVGGKKNYKRAYHLRINKWIIGKVLNALLDVLVEVIEEGDSVIFAGYMVLEPRYFKEIRRRANNYSDKEEAVTPAGYRLKIKAGKSMKDACKTLSEKVNRENTDQETV
ncbi:HU family DNA-binding protein [Anaerotignum sp.]